MVAHLILGWDQMEKHVMKTMDVLKEKFLTKMGNLALKMTDVPLERR